MLAHERRAVGSIPDSGTQKSLAVTDRGHVVARLRYGAQRAAIFRRYGRGKLFGEILRTHGLKDTVGFGSVICAVLVPPVVSSGGPGRYGDAAPFS